MARVRASAPGDEEADVVVEAVALADDAQAHPRPGERVELPAQIEPQQPHEFADLLGGAFPILRREGVEGEIVDAEIDTAAHSLAGRVGAAAMAGDARQAAPCGPAPVAVHDDGDVPRRTRRGRLSRGGGFHPVGPDHT